MFVHCFLKPCQLSVAISKACTDAQGLYIEVTSSEFVKY